MPLTGWRYHLDTLAGQIGWQSTPTGMAPPAQRTFCDFVPR
jgi:hypothetical protein